MQRNVFGSPVWGVWRLAAGRFHIEAILGYYPTETLKG